MKSDHKNVSRREALAALGALASGCRSTFGGLAEKTVAPKKNGGIALQLYTMREPAKQDLAGTLKKVRDIGWEYVQWSGMPNLPADKIRAALDAAGLKAIAAHVSVEAFEKNFDESVQFWKTVGVADVATSTMMNDCRANLEAWLKGAKRLDALGAKLRARRCGSPTTITIPTSRSFPATRATSSTSSWKQPARKTSRPNSTWPGSSSAGPIRRRTFASTRAAARVIHVKDTLTKKGERVKFQALGQGALKWKEIFAAGRKSGIEWYVYEQDNGDGSPFDYARTSYEFLMKNPPQGPAAR